MAVRSYLPYTAVWTPSQNNLILILKNVFTCHNGNKLQKGWVFVCFVGYCTILLGRPARHHMLQSFLQMDCTEHAMK